MKKSIALVLALLMISVMFVGCVPAATTQPAAVQADRTRKHRTAAGEIVSILHLQMGLLLIF